MSAYQFYEGYPDFHRSPRIIYRSSEDKITVNAPGNEPNKSKDELLKLIVPPLVMIGVSILISIFRPRGIYIIATMSMALVTMIFSITGYFIVNSISRTYKNALIPIMTIYLISQLNFRS